MITWCAGGHSVTSWCTAECMCSEGKKEQQGLPLAILIDVDVCLSLSCCYASKVHADPSL